MGGIMLEDDIYIPGLLDLLNLRFGPTQEGGNEWFGGIDEMVALQTQFQIFRKDRTFKESVSILNLGGFWNNRVKNRWYKLLDLLQNEKSNIDGENGDKSIVNSLIRNLESPKPMPVHFKAHDSRTDTDHDRVLIGEGSSPLFYIERQYLIISLPMKPRRRS